MPWYDSVTMSTPTDIGTLIVRSPGIRGGRPRIAGTGVTVLALCPGATKTEFQTVAGVTEEVPEFTYMSAEAVVRQAIAAAKSGTRALVPGWMNKIVAVSARVTPRSVLARIAGSMFAPS